VLPVNNETQIGSLLKQMAADHRPELPSPDLIWWRAHMLRKQEQKQRIEKPIRIVLQLAIAVCTVALLALLVGNWASLATAINGASAPLLALGIFALAVPLVSVVILLRPPAKG
jgi:hypothetical protein